MPLNACSAVTCTSIYLEKHGTELVGASSFVVLDLFSSILRRLAAITRPVTTVRRVWSVSSKSQSQGSVACDWGVVHNHHIPPPESEIAASWTHSVAGEQRQAPGTFVAHLVV